MVRNDWEEPEVAYDCPSLEKSMAKCNCSADDCPRKGNCCECLQHHLAAQQLPACAFPDDIERTYDRSFKRFAQWVMEA